MTSATLKQEVKKAMPIKFQKKIISDLKPCIQANNQPELEQYDPRDSHVEQSSQTSTDFGPHEASLDSYLNLSYSNSVLMMYLCLEKLWTLHILPY